MHCVKLLIFGAIVFVSFPAVLRIRHRRCNFRVAARSTSISPTHTKYAQFLIAIFSLCARSTVRNNFDSCASNRWMLHLQWQSNQCTVFDVFLLIWRRTNDLCAGEQRLFRHKHGEQVHFNTPVSLFLLHIPYLPPPPPVAVMRDPPPSLSLPLPRS